MKELAFTEQSESPQISAWRDVGTYGLIVLATFLVSFGIYAVLPFFGVDAIAHRLNIQLIWKLLALFIGAVIYLQYHYFVLRKPYFLLAIYCVFIPLITYLNSALLSAGFNLSWNALSSIILWVPGLLFAKDALINQWRHVPFFRYFLYFVLFFTLYYLFNNDHAIVLQTTTTSAGTYRTLDTTKAYQLITLLFGQLAIGYTFWKERGKPVAFNQLNKLVIVTILVYALISIISYPLGAFTMVVEGFKRSRFIFAHPNQLGHYMGFLIVYMTGLLMYYQKKDRFPTKLLIASLFLAVGSLVLALSKTAIMDTLAAEAILLLGSFSFAPSGRAMLKYAIWTVCAVIVAVSALQLSGIVDVVGMVSARFSDSTSMNWRTTVWSNLLEDISGWATIFGHGLTASNTRLFQLYYMNNLDPGKGDKLVVAIHNGYLDVLYDFGMLGLIWVLGLLVTIKGNLTKLFSPWESNPQKILLMTILALTVYFLIGCYFDEVLYSSVYPYWFFATVLFCAYRQPTPHEP